MEPTQLAWGTRASQQEELGPSPNPTLAPQAPQNRIALGKALLFGCLLASINICFLCKAFKEFQTMDCKEYLAKHDSFSTKVMGDS